MAWHGTTWHGMAPPALQRPHCRPPLPCGTCRRTVHCLHALFQPARALPATRGVCVRVCVYVCACPACHEGSVTCHARSHRSPPPEYSGSRTPPPTPQRALSGAPTAAKAAAKRPQGNMTMACLQCALSGVPATAKAAAAQSQTGWVPMMRHAALHMQGRLQEHHQRRVHHEDQCQRPLTKAREAGSGGAGASGAGQLPGTPICCAHGCQSLLSWPQARDSQSHTSPNLITVRGLHPCSLPSLPIQCGACGSPPGVVLLSTPSGARAHRAGQEGSAWGDG